MFKIKLIIFFLVVLCINPIVPKVNSITIGEEEKISREFLKYVFQSYEVIDDPLINEYINELGNRILTKFPNHNFKYKFYVINNDAFNAFAGPGGHVFVHSSLLEALDNEEELAGILAHEISHVYCRHISDRIKRSKKIGIGTLAGVAAGIFLGLSGADPQTATALTLGSLAGGQAASLSYSRSDEMQADQIGLEHLTAMGYNGNGLEKALKIIKSQQWFGPDQIPTYLTTHPAVDDRIIYIKNWLANHKKKAAIRKWDNLGFEMTKIKLKVCYDKIKSVRKIIEKNLKNNPGDIPLNYGYALILAQEHNYDKSIVYMRKAIEKRAFDIKLLKEFGRICFEAGKFSESKSIFEGAVSIQPFDPEIEIYLGKIGFKLGDYDKALTLLLPYTKKETHYGNAAYYVGSIYSRQGLKSEAYYYLGLHYLYKKDFRNAIFQLRHALESTENMKKKEEIKALLKKISKEKKKKGMAKKK